MKTMISSVTPLTFNAVRVKFDGVDNRTEQDTSSTRALILVVSSPDFEIPRRIPVHANQQELFVWALPSSTVLSFSIEGCQDEDEKTVVTMPPGVFMSNEANALFFSDVHLAHPDVVSCICACPEDMMLSVVVPSYSLDFFINLFYNALFALPDVGSPVMYLPNGRKRYSIDLTKTALSTWTRAKCVRKYANEFRLGVNSDVRGALNKARTYHTEKSESTWLTPEFIDILVALSGAGHKYGLRVTSFELYDIKDDRRLVACTLGFSLGKAYHDFTMATPERDHRSPGHIVTKTTGAVLKQCGYELWYWGNKIGYMSSYDGKYGGVDIPRNEFYAKWNQLRDIDQNSSKSIHECVASGCAPVKPK
eukprot:PhM_4_TR13673/c0_g1_i1/m.19340